MVFECSPRAELIRRFENAQQRHEKASLRLIALSIHDEMWPRSGVGTKREHYGLSSGDWRQFLCRPGVIDAVPIATRWTSSEGRCWEFAYVPRVPKYLSDSHTLDVCRSAFENFEELAIDAAERLKLPPPMTFPDDQTPESLKSWLAALGGLMRPKTVAVEKGNVRKRCIRAMLLETPIDAFELSVEVLRGGSDPIGGRTDDWKPSVDHLVESTFLLLNALQNVADMPYASERPERLRGRMLRKELAEKAGVEPRCNHFGGQLNRLADAGLIERPTSGGRGSNGYSILPEGRKALDKFQSQ
ncbi:MAG: hypothetical protein WBC44_14360 [Planctomycetaceae bacterium]